MGDAYYIDAPINIYVKPLMTIEGDYKGEPITGETISLIAETTIAANNVSVDFLGETKILMPMTPAEIVTNYGVASPDKKYWIVSFTIPTTIVDSDFYPAVFSATDGYGQTSKDIVDIYVIALWLINFRIENMVNHKPPQYTYPLTRLDLAEKYKAGYKVVFRINVLGSPNNVKARLYEDNTFAKEVDMIQVGVVGNESIWEGIYYSNPHLVEGTMIKINLKGYKGITVYDYNLKEAWNDGGTQGLDMTGNILEVEGTVLKDGVINRTN